MSQELENSQSEERIPWLDHFNRSVERLNEFIQYYTAIPKQELSVAALDIEQGELRDIWKKLKYCYESCLDQCNVTRFRTHTDLESTLDSNCIKSRFAEAHRLFVKTLSQITEIKKSLSERPRTRPVVIQNTPISTTHEVHLPPCDIDPFEGDYISWPTFRDLFDAIYIKNSRLGPVEKLYHLLQKTKGPAKEIVQKVPLTNEGFLVAWDNLKSQYENPRILINRQLKILFNLKRIESDSGSQLKTLQREINNALSALKLYKIDIANWDAIIVYICSTKLPENTLALWEHSINGSTQIPKWSDMDKFLTDRYHTLETVMDIRTPLTKSHFTEKTSNPSSNTGGNRKYNAFHAKNNNFNRNCKLCKGTHSLRICPKFLKLSNQERVQQCKKLGCCNNCLSFSHSTKDCKSNHSCFVCKKHHHTLLHIDYTQSQSRDKPPMQNSQNGAHANNHSSPNQGSYSNNNSNSSSSSNQNHEIPSTSRQNYQSFFVSNPKNVLLGTAIVQLKFGGVSYPVRALIDPASESTFISESLRKRLKLPFKSFNAQICGLNGSVSAKSSKICSFILSSGSNPSVQLPVDALILPKLTGNLPSFSFDVSSHEEFSNMVLADPHFNQSGQVDMLIGGNLYPSILLAGIRHNVFGSLLAQETIFGWILTGPVSNRQSSIVSSFYTEVSLDQQLTRFWEIEEIPKKKFVSESDKFCEDLFSSTTHKSPCGRYVVDLPFKNDFNGTLKLGSTRHIALSQFLRNERSLLRKPEFKQDYDKVIMEYLTLDHMEEVVDQKELVKPNFYLPHHAVVKPDSTTTKLRVVFNASSSSSNGLSLNDVLHTGPVLQADLMTLILKWRFFQFVFNADIEKMYRQILVNPKHTAFQRILFRESLNSPIKDFNLKTVTFGVNCAPYLAIRTLHWLAEDVSDKFPHASTILKNFMYVDDVLAGSHDLQAAKATCKELILALKTARFELRKWTSNFKEILEDIPSEHRLNDEFLQLEDKSVAKTLGVRWNALHDSFYFATQPLEFKPSYTKREVLSIIARLFDPAGWLSPIIITAKIIMQQIWLDKIDWNEQLKPLTLHKWQSFVKSYSQIHQITIPRWINYSPDCNLEFHIFSDASEKAYAATIYVRIETLSGIFTHLLVSKSKVAPVKTISLPRLELCGAELAVKLFDTLVPQFNVHAYKSYFWTDSTIVLAWIRKPPGTWSTFVANRVSRIQSKVGSEHWFHIDTHENPADLATRGTSPEELNASILWWKGPFWLGRPKPEWPISLFVEDPKTVVEMRKVKVNFASSSVEEDILERFSSLPRAYRVLSYIFRFFYRTHPKLKSQFGEKSLIISSKEISNVKTRLVILAQILYYPQEYHNLSNKLPIENKSSLLTLTPYIDSAKVMRMNSRLSASTALTFNERHPIILPYQSRFARLLVNFTHQITLHGGNSLVHRLLLQEFWIIRMKNLIKTCIHNCKICTLYRKKCRTQIMAALPPERTMLSRPFTITGLDFAGPFDIRSSKGRAPIITKGYVCIFVCFATKAVHLELVSDLSTSTFLAAFARFISRRGCPSKLFSDNGRNFVGANAELKRNFRQFIAQTHDEAVSKYGYLQLSWHFMPPGAPHMGGLWEAGVKSFKTHFKKVAIDMKFSFEEFTTLLCRIEACLNSRPLSPSSENPNCFAPLTPAHFLVGGSILSPAEPEIPEDSISALNRWQKMKSLYQVFCKRWKTEYLSELHKRYKWKHPQTNIKLDDLVVIREECLAPNEWRLGRVIETHEGDDGRIRVVKLRTQRGVITRPITKLIPLPNPQ